MVSVCIATYNGEKYIKEQLDSILCQLSDNDEVVISDDGSTDETLNIIKCYNDSRIKIYQANFRNFKKNFENALTKAVGDIIFLSDQDDIWLPQKVNKTCALLETYDLVATNSIVIDQDKKVIHDSFFSYFHSGKGIVKNLMRGTYFGSCMAFKASLLKHVLPFPEEKLIIHDLWIGLVGEIVGNVFFYDEPCILYRRHENAFSEISTNYFGSNKRSLKVRLTARFLIFKKLIQFYIKYKITKK